MNVETSPTLGPFPHGAPAPGPSRFAPPEALDSPLVSPVLHCLNGGNTRSIARAPGRLDVMGGVSEYTGAVTLRMPLAEHVLVGVQVRADDDFLLTLATRSASASSLTPRAADVNGAPPTRIPVSRLLDAGPSLLDGHGAQETNGFSPAVRCALGAVVETLRSPGAPRQPHGLSVSVGLTLCERADLGCAAATAAATVLAASAALGFSLDAFELATLCQRVENDWCGVPAGPADALCSLLGRAGTLTQIRCEPGAPHGCIHLPDETALIGIRSGALPEDLPRRCQRVRTATFMGQTLIDRIIRHERDELLDWRGYLSRICVADYVRRFRDRLPTRLKGSDYLARFGSPSDPSIRIEPAYVYKVRSRTEHHIYEHDRACRMAQCLARAARSGDEKALTDAGELMYASHWSYGQRCGLGSVDANLLVNLLKQQCSDNAVYGAKISGRGCGGIISLLIRNDNNALASVEQVMDAYQGLTGKKATLVSGSSPGAMTLGVRTL